MKRNIRSTTREQAIDTRGIYGLINNVNMPVYSFNNVNTNSN